jgi:hypothetical protein
MAARGANLHAPNGVLTYDTIVAGESVNMSECSSVMITDYAAGIPLGLGVIRRWCIRGLFIGPFRLIIRLE